MKAGKRILVLAAAAVVMSLLLGTHAANAANVIFQSGTNKAIRIENLQIAGEAYTAEFRVNRPAYDVYGPYSGTYTFNSQPSAEEAMRDIAVALTAAGAETVGESGGSEGTPFYNVAWKGRLSVGVESVVVERAGNENISEWIPLGENIWTYNLDSKTYVTFTGGGGEPPPETDDCVDDLHGGVVCLRDGRFEITAEWTDFSNPPVTQPLIWTPVKDINASGGFQNNPDGIQIVMRIADGCSNNNHWWIWLGGFTAGGWDITVRDTVTETEQTYTRERNGGVFPTTERDATTFSCN